MPGWDPLLEEFWTAIRELDTPKIKRMLTGNPGIDVNAPLWTEEYSPILEAASKDEPELFRILLAHGADVHGVAYECYSVFDTESDEILDMAWQAGAIPSPEETRELLSRKAGSPEFQEYLASIKLPEDNCENLFKRIYDYRGSRIFEDILLPGADTVRARLQEMQSYARLSESPGTNGSGNRELYELYALSRVLDTVVLAFQAKPQKPIYNANWKNFMFGRISLGQFESFLDRCGLEAFRTQSFYPGLHEIHAASPADTESTDFEIMQSFWPGVRFGELIILREAVGVRASPSTLDAEYAPTAPLLFSYQRAYREARDLSHGWGSNSQWSTSLVRNYRVPSATDSGFDFYYNVDGEHDLDDELSVRHYLEAGDPTAAQLREILCHRQRLKAGLSYECFPAVDFRWRDQATRVGR